MVLYQPEFENKSTADFFKKAEKSGSMLYRVGSWTKDFNAKPFDAKSVLPKRMKTFSDYKTCSETLIVDLNNNYKSLLQMPVTDTMPSKDMLGRSFIPSFAPSEQGITRLTDGTVILLSGKENVAGDTINKTIRIHGVDVSFDVIGVGAVSLSKDGNVEAIVGGGLKSFKAGGFSIQLLQRVDVVLLKEMGMWQGYVQGLVGKIPDELKKITNNWKRIALPELLD